MRENPDGNSHELVETLKKPRCRKRHYSGDAQQYPDHNRRQDSLTSEMRVDAGFVRGLLHAF
jgi:hypothetical protein